MALIKCPECGRMVSDKAASCPGCGCPIRKTVFSEVKKWVINNKILFSAVIGVILVCIVAAVVIANHAKKNDSEGLPDPAIVSKVASEVEDTENDQGVNEVSQGISKDVMEETEDNSITENEKKLQEKQEYIDKNIELTDFVVEECTGYSGPKPGLHNLSIKNNGDQDITALTIGLDFLGDNGTVIEQKEISVIGGVLSSDVIKAGYSWKMEDDKFYEIENVSGNANLSKVNVYVSDVTLTKPIASEKKSQEEIYIEQYLDITANVGMNSSYHGTVPGISNISIKNNGDRDIEELKVTVYFQDESGKNIAEDTFLVIGGYFGGDTLKANYSWKMESNKFYEFEHLANEVDVSRHTVEITSIKFGN